MQSGEHKNIKQLNTRVGTFWIMIIIKGFSSVESDIFWVILLMWRKIRHFTWHSEVHDELWTKMNISFPFFLTIFYCSQSTCRTEYRVPDFSLHNGRGSSLQLHLNNKHPAAAQQVEHPLPALWTWGLCDNSIPTGGEQDVVTFIT